MHGSARFLPACAAVAALVLITTPGCTRHFYRQAADKDVEGIITQKNIFPQWQMKYWHVYPDPRARYADNSNPDRPPYPPDDYATRLVSPNPQRPTKKSGVGRIDGTGYFSILQQWDAENRAAEAAEGGAASPAPQNATGVSAAPVRGNSASPTGNNAGQVAQAGGVPTREFPPPADLQGDRPAVRHAPSPGMPAALRLAGGNTPGVRPESGPPAPVAKTPVNNEFGPWTAAKPGLPGPGVADNRKGPVITEFRQPVIVVAGEVEQNGKAVPAIAVLPIKTQPTVPVAGQQLPVPSTPPEPLPLPKGVDPKTQPQPNPNAPMGEATPGPTRLVDSEANAYLRALETKQTGYRITLEQTVELAVINAREMQDRREDVYLSALDVTLQRFNFAALGFFTEQAILKSMGRNLTNGGEQWNVNTSGGFNKLFPTGAQLMVQLANQVVIDLSGDKPTTTIGNFSLSLMQPFLQGGGKAVTLEPLTLVERTLLYAIRSYARFRKVFFVAIAAGGGYTNNPYGLQGLSPNLGRGIGGNLTAPSVGFLQLLTLRATVNNQRKYVEALERLLRLYQAFREGGQQSPLQVGQVELQLLIGQGNLLGSSQRGQTSGIRGYFDSLDNFKLQLGLPMTTELDLDDAPMKPIRDQLSLFDELFLQSHELEVQGSKHDPNEPVAAFRKRWLELLTTSTLAKGTAFAKEIEGRWKSWWPDKLTEDQARARLAKLREDRRKLLDARVERELKKLPEPPTEIERLTRLDHEIDLGDFELRVREYETQPWLRKVGKEREQVQDAAFSLAFNAFFLVALEAQNERLATIYASWPKLLGLPVSGIDILTSTLDDAYTVAVQAALTDRLDLMNARAQVVDAWRQIAVIANSLQGIFNVEYDLNSTTPAGGNNPVAFASSRNTNQLKFNVQLPFVRRAQRNNYRAALIAYQRQRRTLMAFEDNIANDVRDDLRLLRTLAELYRIQQRAVELNYSVLDNATATLFAPPVPNAAADPGSAAALTQQVLTAQQNLLNAQNTLFSIWVSYISARMQLYLDLEVMTLDHRGVWCDELYNRSDRQNRPNQQPGEKLPAPRPLNDGGIGGQGR